MAPVTIRRVLNPTGEELDRGAAALSEAFGHRYFIAGLGGDTAIVTPFLRAHLTAAVLGGEVYFAELPGQGVVGAAAWFGPGQKFLSSEKQLNAGWKQIMLKLDAKYSSWWDYFLETYDNFCERALGPGTKLAAYHLQVFGVVPEHQRTGIGGALIKTVEDLAKPRKVALCLETMGETNVNIYKSLGFSVEGSEAMNGPSDKDFVMFCLLKRV